MPRPGIADPYRQWAQKAGFVSRAVFKLQAVDSQFRLIKPGYRVLDLGCSPGSWLQYLAQRVGPKGLVVGVDQVAPQIPLRPPLIFLPMDLLSLDFSALMALSPYFDVVVSDLAPKTSGIKEVDQQRSLKLAWAAWDCARPLLRPGGHFLVKVFQSQEVITLFHQLKKFFERCRRLKPPASRPESSELYLLGLNYRGWAPSQPTPSDPPSPCSQNSAG